MSTNGVNHQEQFAASVPTSAVTAEQTSPTPSSNLSKDEVGWYFVEQYYTTLSKSPDKLHLFYGKKSQFVYGLEAEVANVSVGRQDIQDRILKLDFQDCKVRISNVDSQASMDNIVIQVIGETSNKSEEPRKFVQTFILAQQPSGYFVLNDILRYIKEEDEEPAEATTTAEETAEQAKEEPETKADRKIEEEKVEEKTEEKAELDTTVVDKKLEEVAAVAHDSPSVPSVATPVEAVAVPVARVEPEIVAQVLTPETATQEIVGEDVRKPETPKDPSPTPAAPPAPTPVATRTTTEPEKPKEPPKPMTWASRIAAAAAPASRAAVSVPKTATPPAATPRAAPTAIASPATAPAKPVVEAQEEAALKDSGNEWQTAGGDSKRQNRPLSISGASQDKENTLGYVKYVTEKVEAETLRSHLEKFGPVVYFDINRAKNCAFIEFATSAGYQAAVAANPHTVNGKNILVEARLPKASAYGGSNYSNRGNASGRGRGGYEGRNGSQGGGRGGFSAGQNRGRGGAGAGRGRGSSQITA